MACKPSIQPTRGNALDLEDQATRQLASPCVATRRSDESGLALPRASVEDDAERGYAPRGRGAELTNPPVHAIRKSPRHSTPRAYRHRLVATIGVSTSSALPRRPRSAICSHSHTLSRPAVGFCSSCSFKSARSREALNTQPAGACVGAASLQQPSSPTFALARPPNSTASSLAPTLPPAMARNSAEESARESNRSCHSGIASEAEATTYGRSEMNCSVGPARYSKSSARTQSHSQPAESACRHAPTIASLRAAASASRLAPAATRSTRSAGGGNGHKCWLTEERSREAPPLPRGRSCHALRALEGARSASPSANRRWSKSSCSAPRAKISAAIPLARSR
eukprot:scaffold74020_cov27-Tisochrysis_lutea.AAC.2